MPKINDLAPAYKPEVSNAIATFASPFGAIAPPDEPQFDLLAPESNAFPYIMFNEPRGKNHKQLCEQGYRDGEAILMVDGASHKWEPAEMLVVKSRDYWITMDAKGEVTGAARGPEAPSDAYKEFILVYTLNFLDGVIIPAVSRFKTAKVGAIKRLVGAIHQTTDIDWPGKSEANTLAAGYDPWMRVYGTVSTTMRTSRAGLDYALATSVVRTIDATRLTRLLEWIAEPLNVDHFRAGLEKFKEEADRLDVMVEAGNRGTRRR